MGFINEMKNKNIPHRRNNSKYKKEPRSIPLTHKIDTPNTQDQYPLTHKLVAHFHGLVRTLQYKVAGLNYAHVFCFIHPRGGSTIYCD
jgi:hypothetical protein